MQKQITRSYLTGIHGRFGKLLLARYDGAPKTFTQEEVDNLVNQRIADANKANDGKIKQLQDELKLATTGAKMTKEERAELERRLDEAKTANMTATERHQHELGKLAKEHKSTVEGLTGERDTWHSRFEKSTIERSITDAAAVCKACSPKQVVALLGPTARLVEGTDEGGKLNGEFVVRVMFNDTDKHGKPVRLDLTAEEAVKRMTELDEFQNLFSANGAGGMGGRGGSKDKANMDEIYADPEKYREWRAKQTKKGN